MKKILENHQAIESTSNRAQWLTTECQKRAFAALCKHLDAIQRCCTYLGGGFFDEFRFVGTIPYFGDMELEFYFIPGLRGAINWPEYWIQPADQDMRRQMPASKLSTDTIMQIIETCDVWLTKHRGAVLAAQKKELRNCRAVMTKASDQWQALNERLAEAEKTLAMVDNSNSSD